MTQERVRLEDVYLGGQHAISELFLLLEERTPAQSISHSEMPSYAQHKAFVESRPYKAWYLISADGVPGSVGAVYLSKQREIGIFIFKDQIGRGYGWAAVEKLMEMHPGTFYANVNPSNLESIDLFRRLGFSLLQLTFKR